LALLVEKGELPKGTCHVNLAVAVPDGQSCTFNCGYRDAFWSSYICRDGRWYADTVNGQMCEQFATAGCVYNGTAVVCDRCGREGSLTPLIAPPDALPASVTVVVVRCHSIVKLFQDDGVTYVDVTHLDLSQNSIQTPWSASLVWLRRLEYLNLSHNLLTELQHSQITSAGRMRTLDLSHNRIAHIEPYALRSNLVPDCNVAADFRFEGNPCLCQLQRRMVGSKRCNDVLCNCTAAETETVVCGATLGGNGTETILASQVCDGIAHCSNCWDEVRVGGS
jgi:hypothetical protein